MTWVYRPPAPQPSFRSNGLLLLLAPPAAPVYNIIDTFTDTGGTTLTAHPPDAGGSWTLQKGNNPLITSSPTNKARAGGTAISVATYSVAPPSADYSVFAAITAVDVGIGNYAGLVARHQGATDSFYVLQMALSEGQWRIRKTLAAAPTAVTATNFSFTEGQTYIVEFRISGTSLQGWIDGNLVCDGTDSDISSAGLVGLYFDGTGTPTDANQPRLDDIGVSFSLVGGAQAITGDTITAGSQLFPPTVAPQAVAVTGGTIASGNQPFAPSVAAGAVAVTGGTVASTAALYPPAVEAVAAMVLPNTTVDAGGWVDQDSNTTDLHSPLADSSAATWDQSPANPVNATLKLGITDLPAPTGGQKLTLEVDCEQVI